LAHLRHVCKSKQDDRNTASLTIRYPRSPPRAEQGRTGGVSARAKEKRRISDGENSCGGGSRPERLPASQSLATGPIARGAAELLGKAGRGGAEVAGKGLWIRCDMETCSRARSEEESKREVHRERERAKKEGPRRLGSNCEESSSSVVYHPCARVCLPPAEDDGDINKHTSIQKKTSKSPPRPYRTSILMNHDGDGDLCL
jgi:hypothetical protein